MRKLWWMHRVRFLPQASYDSMVPDDRLPPGTDIHLGPDNAAVVSVGTIMTCDGYIQEHRPDGSPVYIRDRREITLN